MWRLMRIMLVFRQRDVSELIAANPSQPKPITPQQVPFSGLKVPDSAGGRD